MKKRKKYCRINTNKYESRCKIDLHETKLNKKQDFIPKIVSAKCPLTSLSFFKNASTYLVGVLTLKGPMGSHIH